MRTIISNLPLALLMLALGVACGGCHNDGLTWSTAQAREEKPRDADERFREAIRHYSDGYGPTDVRLSPVLDMYAKFLRATGRTAAADTLSANAHALRAQ
ncbi:MAG: hypothetical protein ABI876_09755 [Bacteroidota bacterium]